MYLHVLFSCRSPEISHELATIEIVDVRRCFRTFSPVLFLFVCGESFLPCEQIILLFPQWNKTRAKIHQTLIMHRSFRITFAFLLFFLLIPITHLLSCKYHWTLHELLTQDSATKFSLFFFRSFALTPSHTWMCQAEYTRKSFSDAGKIHCLFYLMLSFTLSQVYRTSQMYGTYLPVFICMREREKETKNEVRFLRLNIGAFRLDEYIVG